MVSGKVYTGDEVRELFPFMDLGDASYAEVNSAWLPAWYRLYRARLYRLGIVHGSKRFDCNRFSDIYVSLAHAHFSVSMHHSDIPAEAIAIGTVWYKVDNRNERHALVLALTERGRLFIDPQCGREVVLSETEIASIFHQRM